MRLNWFSPLPPAHTEIANHTARLLPALCDRARVVLWTDQEEWSADLERHAPVRRYEPGQVPWAEVNRADVSVYNLGNNARFHAAIWDVSRRQPGLVVLHDTRLQHFFLNIFQQEGLTEYRAQMTKYYGPSGAAATTGLLWGQLSVLDLTESFPLTDLALENALGVVVHNRLALPELSRKGRWPVAYAPLPYVAGPPPAPTPLPAAGSTQPTYRLIVFGFIGANRRLEAVLKALARFPARACFGLDVYGQVAGEDRVRALIQSLDLSGLVALHGYVAEPQLESALAASHLAFNLRYPTMGEASASQLRIWAHSLPSAVSQVGWYATLPADTVLFVRPDQEAEDLRSVLQGLLSHPDRYRRLGENGRRHLEQHHTADGYVTALLRLAEKSGPLRGRVLAAKMAERAAEALSPWSFPGPLPAAFRRVAEELHRLTCAG
jgi:glycosyltransferase involved in cell wall biosynthesis